MPSRREVVAALASTAVLPLLSACMKAGESAAGANEGAALALLDECADHLLALFPETATSLGLDTGDRAPLRSQLTDRSEAGKRRIAEQVRADLERVTAFDATGLSDRTRTSLAVVKSAYTTALEGFAKADVDELLDPQARKRERGCYVKQRQALRDAQQRELVVVPAG